MDQPGKISAGEIVKRSPDPAVRWLHHGDEFLACVLESLRSARHSVRLEMYIFANDPTGLSVRAALAEAAGRGVSVRVMTDALGSAALPGNFWEPLVTAGGEVKVFNPLSHRRLMVRNHRKLLVVDDAIAILGGFNIADEYTGDGVAAGWADCGLTLKGVSLAALSRSFERMFARCDEQQPRLVAARLRKGERPPPEEFAPKMLLLENGPGRQPSAFQKLLRHDIARSREVFFVSAYFLPGYRMRRILRGIAQRGARVQIIVPGKSDVPVSQRAARFLYAGLMRAGVEIWEDQPQVLHAKLFLANGSVYAGSSNLDTRSLHLNHEIMLCLGDPAVVAGARELFAELLSHSRRIDPEAWKNSRSRWEKLREQVAFWLLSRVDPYLTRWLAQGK